MRVIPFAALAPVPWANGGGVTREIAAGRDADAILWRVSLAEVETEGPFSFLPGLHRILTVVGGAGDGAGDAGGQDGGPAAAAGAVLRRAAGHGAIAAGPGSAT